MTEKEKEDAVREEKTHEAEEVKKDEEVKDRPRVRRLGSGVVVVNRKFTAL